ncbi:MAG: YdiU family protein [Myxococcota bacterium]
MTISTAFAFDNTYATQMKDFVLPARAADFPAPKLLALNEALAAELGLDVEGLRAEGHLIFSGQDLPKGAAPVAQFYAGHQFGGFSPQLGDGRAMMLGEVVAPDGRRVDLQLKGSGPTEFSRGGDGKAAIGPVLREYLMGEAMHALGIPTTRMLAAVATGEPVFREETLPGAVVTRVASSHLRVGTFEFYGARQDVRHTRLLADYAITRHYPHLEGTPNKYIGLLNAVGDAQADLIAHWMLVGFIHGVMNTDNVTISGQTIDFGPCAFMDTFGSRTVFSSIDRGGRYAYGNQPGIGQWNLARFAETLLPLLDNDTEVATEHARQALRSFALRYQSKWTDGMRAKLGILEAEDEDEGLAERLTALLEEQALDYTTTMRRLSDVLRFDDGPFRERLADPDAFDAWAKPWLARLDAQEGGRAAAADRMDAVNPVYIPRNHLVEQALAAAIDDRDLGPFERLLDAVTQPYTPRAGFETYAEPAPRAFTQAYKTFCGT